VYRCFYGEVRRGLVKRRIVYRFEGAQFAYIQPGIFPISCQQRVLLPIYIRNADQSQIWVQVSIPSLGRFQVSNVPEVQGCSDFSRDQFVDLAPGHAHVNPEVCSEVKTKACYQPNLIKYTNIPYPHIECDRLSISRGTVLSHSPS